METKHQYPPYTVAHASNNEEFKQSHEKLSQKFPLYTAIETTLDSPIYFYDAGVAYYENNFKFQYDCCTNQVTVTEFEVNIISHRDLDKERTEKSISSSIRFPKSFITSK